MFLFGYVKNDRTGPPKPSERHTFQFDLCVQLSHCSCSSCAAVCNSSQIRLAPVAYSGRKCGAFPLERCKNGPFHRTVKTTSSWQFGVHGVIERGPHKNKQPKPLAGPSDMVCRSRRMSSTAAADGYKPRFRCSRGHELIFQPLFLGQNGGIFAATR